MAAMPSRVDPMPEQPTSRLVSIPVLSNRGCHVQMRENLAIQPAGERAMTTAQPVIELNIQCLGSRHAQSR